MFVVANISNACDGLALDKGLPTIEPSTSVGQAEPVKQTSSFANSISGNIVARPHGFSNVGRNTLAHIGNISDCYIAIDDISLRDAH